MLEDKDQRSMTKGTVAYMAPELFELGTCLNDISVEKPIDIWAMGVTLYQITYGFLPFKGRNMIELKNQILK